MEILEIFYNLKMNYCVIIKLIYTKAKALYITYQVTETFIRYHWNYLHTNSYKQPIYCIISLNLFICLPRLIIMYTYT